MDSKAVAANRTFGYRSTAKDVLQGVDVKGKVVVITGGANGIGLEASRAFAAAGAKVVVAVRNPKQGQEAVTEIKKTIPNAEITVRELDLASLKSVRQFAEDYLKSKQPLHFLINNAGVMACDYSKTKDGFEMQFGTNHIGHFVLSNLLVPALTASRPSRVVIVSSCAHNFGGVNWDDINFTTKYDKWEAYRSSKTANVLFAREFNHRYEKLGITSFSLHPGGIMTGLQKHLSIEEQRARDWISEDGKVNPLFKTQEEGASTMVWGATAPELEGKGGSYLEDCGVAEKCTTNKMKGVSDYALDMKAALRLWELSEKAVNQTFPAPK
jgi:NAD(P)-dependent dehydrogenase (short-subunit alcohol dehydrogenase family)